MIGQIYLNLLKYVFYVYLKCVYTLYIYMHFIYIHTRIQTRQTSSLFWSDLNFVKDTSMIIL